MPALNLGSSRDLGRSFGFFFGHLFRDRKADHAQLHAEALAEVRAKWRAARSEYARCKEAGDKRGMGEAVNRAKRFANQAMRLERGL